MLNNCLKKLGLKRQYTKHCKVTVVLPIGKFSPCCKLVHTDMVVDKISAPFSQNNIKTSGSGEAKAFAPVSCSRSKTSSLQPEVDLCRWSWSQKQDPRLYSPSTKVCGSTKSCHLDSAMPLSPLGTSWRGMHHNNLLVHVADVKRALNNLQEVLTIILPGWPASQP